MLGINIMVIWKYCGFPFRVRIILLLVVHSVTLFDLKKKCLIRCTSRPITRRPSPAITEPLSLFGSAREKEEIQQQLLKRGSVLFKSLKFSWGWIWTWFYGPKCSTLFIIPLFCFWNQMRCLSFNCEVFPVSELITIHRFKQTLISLYSAPLPSFRCFCRISLSSLSALCFLAHFPASLSARSVSILLGRHLYVLLSAAPCARGLWMEIEKGLWTFPIVLKYPRVCTVMN